MSMTVTEIKTAFAGGSGINATELAIDVAVGVFVLAIAISITALFKRLKIFERDDNAHELLRETGIIFFVIILTLIIIGQFVYW